MIRRVYLPIASAIVSVAPLFGQLDRSGPPDMANTLAQNTARVEAGAREFRRLCTSCHGRDGEGGQGEGRGPNLATSWEVRRAKDQDIFGFIKNGVKGTAMPAFSLPDEQVWELAAFVRSLNAPADSAPLQGDASAGGAIFFGKGGCAACHMIKGRGGYLGPDLSNIGAERRLNELRDVIVNPSSTPASDFRPLLLKDSNNRQVRAIAKHSSSWSAQVLDENGHLHLVHGDAVHQLMFQSKSWMPTDIPQRLSTTEITNVLAFLSRQSIRPPNGPVATRPSAKGVVE